MAKELFTYTTQIPPEKTIREIQKELIKHGARSILIDYDNKEISALSFNINTPMGNKGIRLPCNQSAVLNILKRQHPNRDISKGSAADMQAHRVAWRIILYWVKAQMAILETEMVTMDQIFLPYMIANDGKTFYEKLLDSKFQITGDIE